MLEELAALRHLLEQALGVSAHIPPTQAPGAAA